MDLFPPFIQPPPTPAFEASAKHCIADTISGEIVRTMICTPTQAAQQVRAGEVLSQTDASNASHWWDGTQLVAYAAAQATDKAARPAWRAVWSNTNMRWQDLRTLAVARASKWDEIKAQGRALDAAPITLQSREFACHAEARAMMAWKVTLAREAIADGQAFSVDWPLTDDSTVTLNAAQLKAVVRAIDARSDSLRNTAQQLRTQINNAATAAAVDAIAWPG